MLGQATAQERARAEAERRARAALPEGAPTEQQVAEGRAALARLRQAHAEGQECGNAETICSILPHKDSIRPMAGGGVADTAVQLTDMLVSFPVYFANAVGDQISRATTGDDMPVHIPTALEATGLHAESVWCAPLIEYLPAAIELMTDAEVEENFQMSKDEAQTLLCQAATDLTALIEEPSTPEAFPIECSPGFAPAFETPEGRTVGSDERKPPGTRFVGCELSLSSKADIEREVQGILAESREEYRLAFDEIRAQQALGILAPAEAERARRAAARAARSRAAQRIEEARGVYTFPPMDLGEDEVKAAAAGGAAGLILGALLVWAATQKK
jgi:hypothetical protein